MAAVVSDSSPIVYLARLGRFALLQNLHDRIYIPRAVWIEVAVNSSANPEGRALKSAEEAGWLCVEDVEGAMDPELADLGVGERDAIMLARSKQALLIIDELEGRALAEQLGVKCIGTIGVLVGLKLRGLIPSLKEELERLKHDTNFRFTDSLFALALSKAGESSS